MTLDLSRRCECHRPCAWCAGERTASALAIHNLRSSCCHEASYRAPSSAPLASNLHRVPVPKGGA
jgi:hypothetical protein